MCLVIDKKQCPNGYKIAKKNIPCYKVLLKRYDGTFETPHVHQSVDITKGIEADCFQTEPFESDHRIHKGIHSYTKLATAYKAQIVCYDSLNIFVYIGVIVVKAYIPKGTKYWVGKNHEFCSERIVFAEK